MAVNRDGFLSTLGKRRYRDVTLPTSGVTVRVQSLMEAEKSDFEAANYDNKGQRIRGRFVDSRARLIVLCLVDDAGERLLKPGDEADVMRMDASDSQYLWDVLWDHVGMNPKDLEDEAKN
jgi:hypothetical protein